MRSGRQRLNRGGTALLAAAAALLGGCGHATAPRPAAHQVAASTPADTAVRAAGTPQLRPLAWAAVPAAVTAWLHTHRQAPAETTLRAGKDFWAVLTTGQQPTAVHLFPLQLQRDLAGAASVQVALARDAPAAAGGHSALAVQLGAGLSHLTFDLHLAGGGAPVPLGAVASGACTAGPTALQAARACAARLGLLGATWTDPAGPTATAVLDGQRVVVTTRRTRAGALPARLGWAGPA